MPQEKEAEPASWSDMIKTIELSKKQLPWDIKSTQPVRRINLVERRIQERELDPVAMKYRTPANEAAVAQIKEEKERNVQARVSQIRHSKFNIVSHQGPARKIDAMLTEDRSGEGRPRHLITHLPRQDHEEAPTVYDDDYTISKLRPKQVPKIERSATRDFSIISNQYNEDHDEKQRHEYEKTKEFVTKKYWSTHDYDALRGKYYDKEKEGKYWAQRELLTEVQGSAQEMRLPPRFVDNWYLHTFTYLYILGYSTQRYHPL